MSFVCVSSEATKVFTVLSSSFSILNVTQLTGIKLVVNALDIGSEWAWHMMLVLCGVRRSGIWLTCIDQLNKCLTDCIYYKWYSHFFVKFIKFQGKTFFWHFDFDYIIRLPVSFMVFKCCGKWKTVETMKAEILHMISIIVIWEDYNWLTSLI